MKWPGLAQRDLSGVRFAVNVFIASAILWYLLRHIADTNPIWSIASMVAASEPQVKEARRMFRSRTINVLVGCVVGLLFLILGGASEWKLPLALAVTVLVSSYLIHIQTMWRQAPITAAIVIAAGLTHHSKVIGGGGRAAQGGGGDSGLHDGTVRELDHVPGLALAGGAGQGRVDPRRGSHLRFAVTRCWRGVDLNRRAPPSTNAQRWESTS